MNKKILSGGILLTLLVLAGVVFAHPFMEQNQNSQRLFNFEDMEEIHKQIEEAISSGDYSTWLMLHEDNNLPFRGNIIDVINEDNFYLLTEMQEHRNAIEEIHEELGIEPKGKGFRQGMGPMEGRGMHNGQRGMRQKIPFENQIE